MTYADLGGLGPLSAQVVLVGDPGQVAPVVTGDSRRWQDLAAGPQRAAPEALVAAYPESVTQLRLSSSWRLGPQTTALIQPAFYADLPFTSVRPPRHIQLDGAALPELSVRLVTPLSGPGDPSIAAAAIPDTTPMWPELAAFGTGPAPLAAREAPSLLTTEYESPQVQRASARLRAASATEQWGIAELMVDGPSHGNPFVDVELHAIFRREGKEVLVGGFYDGEGTYHVRFHPLSSGTWTFVTRSNARSVDGLTGSVEVSPHSAGNHGRVVVRAAYAQPGGGPRADEQPQLRPCKPLVDEFAERFRGVSAEDVDTSVFPVQELQQAN